MVPGIQQRQIVARDGTRIGYQVRGEGPAVVLANGLGGTYLAFRYLYDALGAYKTICWDYRGLYTSGPASDPTANTVVHQVDDLAEILAAEHVDDFVIAGWSMGVQVAFETYRRMEQRVRGIFAINGTYGRAFRTVMGSRVIGRTLPVLIKLIKAQAKLAAYATKRLTSSNFLFEAAARAGLVSKTADSETIRKLAEGFQTIDWTIYSDLLTRLDEHDAEEVLEHVAVPTSIVTGDRDLMTPPTTAEYMHRKIRGSRLVVIEGGTHYTPVEYPAILVDELGKLLDRVPGWEREGAVA